MRSDIHDLPMVIESLLSESGAAAGLTGDDVLLDMSSLELVRFLIALEERLAVEFDDESIMNMSLETVQDIVDLVEHAHPSASEPAAR